MGTAKEGVDDAIFAASILDGGENGVRPVTDLGILLQGIPVKLREAFFVDREDILALGPRKFFSVKVADDFF